MKEKHIHGGDVYRRPGILDFSANCNPFGTPSGVIKAGAEAMGKICCYPDVEYQGLRQALAEEEEACFHPETGELLLGDIMIAVPRMQEQAESYGHSQIREFSFLIAHSMLHLMGYDHMTPQEAAVMEQKQEEILLNLGITRA